MDIAIMTKADLPQVLFVWKQDGVGLGPDDTIENLSAYLERNPRTSFVAKEGDEIVGAIMAGHDGYRGFIHHTAVASDFRRKGVGKLLVEAATKAIYDEGVNKVVLVVFSENDGAGAFWEKQGFSVRGDLQYRDRRNSK